MGNDWTRLTQEASRHGGPDAMRGSYVRKGALILLTCQLTGQLISVGMKKRRVKKAEAEQEARMNAVRGRAQDGTTDLT